MTPSFNQLVKLGVSYLAVGGGASTSPQNAASELTGLQSSTDAFANAVGRKMLQANPFLSVAPPPPVAVTVPVTTPAPLPQVDVTKKFSGLGAVIPSNSRYGACKTPVSSTFADIDALKANGGNAFFYDCQSTDSLNDITAVVNYAAGKNMGVILSVYKDDVSMSNRVPTNTTFAFLTKLANQFKAYDNVNLCLGGQPNNFDGSQSNAILQTYANGLAAINATGFRSTTWVAAWQGSGRQGPASVVNAPIAQSNTGFVLYPYSGGNSTQVQEWLNPCKTLKCLTINGGQVNRTLDVANTVAATGLAIQLAKAQNTPAWVNPWAGSEIVSEGEKAMLTGNTCTNSAAARNLTSAGSQLVNLAKGI